MKPRAEHGSDKEITRGVCSRSPRTPGLPVNGRRGAGTSSSFASGGAESRVRVASREASSSAHAINGQRVCTTLSVGYRRARAREVSVEKFSHFWQKVQAPLAVDIMDAVRQRHDPAR